LKKHAEGDQAEGREGKRKRASLRVAENCGVTGRKQKKKISCKGRKKSVSHTWRPEKKGNKEKSRNS